VTQVKNALQAAGGVDREIIFECVSQWGRGKVKSLKMIFYFAN